MKPKTGAIIAAAGNSQRTGNLDKLFALIGRKPLLYHVLSTFELCPPVDQIVLVLSEDNLMRGRSLIKRYSFSKVSGVCVGGQRRQDSVKQGLDLLNNCDLVIIHDGARPLVTASLIKQGIDIAKEHGTAVAAVPVTSTIKVADNDCSVVKTLIRDNLWEVQTPQVYQYDIIAQAHKNISDDVTDDATMVERIGYKVKLYISRYDNIKVTTMEDISLARLILKTRGR